MTSKSKISSFTRIVFWISVSLLGFVMTGKFLDVYKYKFTGAVFEILWLPALLLILVCPIVSLIFWIKQKLSLKSLNFFALILSLISFLLTFFRTN